MKRAVPLTTRLQDVQAQLSGIINDVDDLIQADLVFALIVAHDGIKDVIASLINSGI